MTIEERLLFTYPMPPGKLDQMRRLLPGWQIVFWDEHFPDIMRAVLACINPAKVAAQDELVSAVQALSNWPVDRWDTIQTTLSSLPGSLALSWRPPPGPPYEVGDHPVLFVPSNDTHVVMFARIAQHLANCHFLLLDRLPYEHADVTLLNLGLGFTTGGVQALRRLQPSILVTGNDWSNTIRKLMVHGEALGIMNVCIQEGCLDFDDGRRMQNCTFPFVQGPIMLRHLKQRGYFVTGNPRFDDLQPSRLPELPQVFINSNFTYNVYENYREKWVMAAVRACQELGVDYFISQHPRDEGQFPGLPVHRSGAAQVHKQIAAASLVISRFSTIIYEALCMGRPVIYYNPHHEPMRLFNEDTTGGIYRVSDENMLPAILSQALQPVSPARENRMRLFLEQHCGPSDGRSAQRCAAAVAQIATGVGPLHLSARARAWWKTTLAGRLPGYLHARWSKLVQ